MSRRHSPNDKSQNPSDEQRYCICQKTEDELDEQDFMIECDGCNGWFHGKCIGLADRIADDIEKYFCDECAKQHGPSIFKQRKNQHRRDFSDANADNKPTQSGTQDFITKLKRKIFPSCESVITRLKGNQVTEEYLIQNGFTKPILVANRDGLELTLPNRAISLAEIHELVGPDRFIDIIDCEKQVTYKMSLEEYIEYFESFERNKIYNVLSLEVSDTKLGEQITLPRIVRDLSWASTGIWPMKNTDDNDQRKKQVNWSTQNRRRTVSSTDTDPSDDELDANHFENFQRPEVTKYCLMSPQASYTDFHVDFGGSSVWYSVVRGEKIFYIIEPTDENLQKYADWSRSPTESETFLGDCVSHCYKLHLKEDNTVFIPAGWIHAVYTVTDSLVFGGNFLQSMGVDMQLRIYELERLAQVPNKFQFPLFETFHWYAAKSFYDDIKNANDSGSSVSPITQQASDSILHYMSKWLSNDKRYSIKNRLIIPKGIQCDKLLRDLGRELDIAKSRGGSSFHSKPPSLSIITSPMKIESKHELVQMNHTKIKVKCRRLSPEGENTKTKGNQMKLTIKTKLTGCRKPNQNRDPSPIINKKKANRINLPIKQEELPKMTYTLDLESKRQRFIEPSTSHSSSHDPLESSDDTSTNDSTIPEDIPETNEIFENIADGGLASFVRSSSDDDHGSSQMKREHSQSEKKILPKKLKTKETDKLNKTPKKIKSESVDSTSKPAPSSTTPKSASSTSLPKKRPSSSSSTTTTSTPKKSNSKDPLGKILKIANSIKSRGGILT